MFYVRMLSRLHLLLLRYAAAVDRHPAHSAVPSVLQSNPPPARGSCTPSSTSWAALCPASCCPAPSLSSSGKMWVLNKSKVKILTIHNEVHSLDAHEVATVNLSVLWKLLSDRETHRYKTTPVCYRCLSSTWCVTRRMAEATVRCWWATQRSTESALALPVSTWWWRSSS